MSKSLTCDIYIYIYIYIYMYIEFVIEYHDRMCQVSKSLTEEGSVLQCVAVSKSLTKEGPLDMGWLR